jgi:4-amino-4-deoxy-L-arabinose transferase-like glycosyltransferase
MSLSLRPHGASELKLETGIVGMTGRSLTGQVKVYLGILVLTAFAVRAVWIWQFTGVIENEGAAYARIAENLFSGRGYLGILGGRDTLLPPLYPGLMRVGAQIVGSMEAGGRLVSALTSSLLILPGFVLGRRLWGDSAGWWCAGLLAFHPLLVSLGATTYCESTYLLLLFAAFVMSLRLLEEPAMPRAVLTGFLFGLAELVRPLALAYPVTAAALLLACGLWKKAGRKRAISSAAVIFLVAVVTFCPYIAYLSINSGYLRVEGKSLVNNIIGVRMRNGMSYPEAACGLGPNLELEGPYLTADGFEIRWPENFPSDAGLLADHLQGILWRTFDTLKAILTFEPFGSLLFVGVAVIGFFLTLGSRLRLRDNLAYLYLVGLYFPILLAVEFRWNRYLLPWLPMLTPWAAVGLVAFQRLVRRRLEQLIPKGGRGPALASYVLSAIVVVAITARSLPAVLKLAELSQGRDQSLRLTGEWLRLHGAEGRTVMGISAVVPYYAGASLAYLPYTNQTQALEYVRAVDPAYIVIRGSDRHRAPYLPLWLHHGLPDPRAEEAYRYKSPDGDQVVVFRWNGDQVSRQSSRP